MIVNYPKAFPVGHVEKSMVSTMDILPSIMQEAGITIPEGTGRNSSAISTGRHLSPAKVYPHLQYGSSANILHLTFGICDQRYKLIYNPVRITNTAAISRYKNTAIPEVLWDPDYIDPPELSFTIWKRTRTSSQTWANTDKHIAKLEELFKALRDFQKEIGDPFLDPANVDFYIGEMQDPRRHPKKRSQEVWSHLKKFYPSL